MAGRQVLQALPEVSKRSGLLACRRSVVPAVSAAIGLGLLLLRIDGLLGGLAARFLRLAVRRPALGMLAVRTGLGMLAVRSWIGGPAVRFGFGMLAAGRLPGFRRHRERRRALLGRPSQRVIGLLANPCQPVRIFLRWLSEPHRYLRLMLVRGRPVFRCGHGCPAAGAFLPVQIGARGPVSFDRCVGFEITDRPRTAFPAVAVGLAGALGLPLFLLHTLDQPGQILGDGIAWVLRVPAVQMLPPVLLP